MSPTTEPHRFCFSPEQIIAQANGCFLRYTGSMYLPGAQPERPPGGSGLRYLREQFAELGALAIRYPIALRQRAALLCQIMDGRYDESPVDLPAPGGNQGVEQLFRAQAECSPTRRTTMLLGQAALGTLGRGRVLNERGQPLLHLNTLQLSGELGAWDLLHAVLWSVGGTLPQQLERQGFAYLVMPPDASRDDYERVDAWLRAGRFDIAEEQSGFLHGHLRTPDGDTVMLVAPTAIEKICVEEDHSRSWQANALLVAAGGGEPAPAGWFLHRGRKSVLENALGIDLLRIILMARGGFHRLSPAQKSHLQTGTFADNGLATFIQNQTFNAMLVVLQVLEEQYDFDAAALLPPSFVTHTAERLRTLAAGGFSEDFLTGALLTEMVQVLRRIRHGSHARLPAPLSASFPELQNNARALARAFGLASADGMPLLRPHTQGRALYFDERLIDLHVAGELAAPAFRNGRHIAAVLAAALLVSEQALLAQLLSSACMYGRDHPDRRALERTLGSTADCDALIKRARSLPVGAEGPMLGLEHACCDPLVTDLRRQLGHDMLAEAALMLTNPASLPAFETRVSRHGDLRAALSRLTKTARILQEAGSTSALDAGSRGVCAGAEALQQRFFPSPAKQSERRAQIKLQAKLLEQAR